MKIAITSDSVCDLTKEMLEQNKIVTIPLSIILGDEIKFDGLNVSTSEIFSYVEKNKVLPKTSAINENDYENFFKKNLKGHDALIHFSLSSKISCSHQNACLAANKLKNVYVIDSLSLSTGVGLQILYACQLRDQNLPATEIVKKVMNRRKYVQASFVVDKLDYLYKGGRCTSLQLLGANMLHIRPSILVENGKMDMHNKYRGKIEDVVEKYIKDTLSEFNTPDNSVCFITYSTATPKMLEAARNSLKATGFKNIYETTAGCTITSHCGKNTLGILYYNDGNASE